MYIAKPNMLNDDGVQSFQTVMEAVKYLNQYTEVEEYGSRMQAEDWYIVGKLRSTKGHGFKGNKAVVL